MDIDTQAIRRLRDHLLARIDAAGDGTESKAGTQHESADTKEAVARRVEPFAETMYLVMIADGQSDSIERRAMSAALDVLAGGQMSAGDIEVMLDRFDESAQRVGTEARLAQIGSRLCADPDDRETAFSLGAVVALADDRVDFRENHALEWIKKYFGVSDRRVAAILDAIH